MVYYGAWIQPDDYDRTGVRRVWDDGTNGSSGIRFDDDPSNPTYPLTGDDAADMNTRLDLARAATPQRDKGVSAIQMGGWLPGFASPQNGYIISNGAQRIGLRDGARNPPTFAIPPTFEWPAGATGYEWESNLGTIVSARLDLGDVEADGSANDYADSDNDGHLAAVGTWTLALKVRSDQGLAPTDYGGTIVASWSSEGHSPVSRPFDVTSLVDADGRFIMLGQGDATVTDFDRDEHGYWGCSLDVSIIESDPYTAVNSPGYGSCRVTYTIHPPRYRWIYEGSRRREPPLRVNQRGNDGLGITGGRRIVQNRTLQSTNRRGAVIR